MYDIYNNYINRITSKLVLESGWITTISTGLGTLPFICTTNINEKWIGICNAIAGGMMISASISLLEESFEIYKSLFGAFLGALFVFNIAKILDKYNNVKFDIFKGIEANKMLLFIAVMTFHSFAEGIAIGVSFASNSGKRLGMIITSTLAIHNIPEGLAVSLILIPQKVSLIKTCIWCIFTSLPQPFMAVIAFKASLIFSHLVSIGLGFAAGAMIYVAITELLIDAIKSIGKLKTILGMSLSISIMNIINRLVHDIY